MVLRLLLHIWSWCDGLLDGVPVADVKRGRRGGAPYSDLSRSTCINGKPYPLASRIACSHTAACFGRGPCNNACLCQVPVYGLLYVIRTAFGRLVSVAA